MIRPILIGLMNSMLSAFAITTAQQACRLAQTKAAFAHDLQRVGGKRMP